jgi:hypothetical protein
MVAKHLQNTSTANYQIQAHILYHWLTFVNQFTVVEANGANWTPLHFSSSSGIANSTTPQAFYDANPVFDATFVGKHIAIRDASNPTNCLVAQITALISPTRVNLDATAVLDVDSSNIEYIVFDTTATPAAGDFFVIQTPVTTGPQWQARCEVSAAPAALEWQLGFNGGWDVGTGTWILPVSSSHWLPLAVARTFCVADSAVGYFYLWSEGPPGGVAANRNAIWIGALSPFHSPAETGVPKDLEYSAIFGSTTSPGPANNLSRDTTVVDNFVVGEVLNLSGVVINAYMAQKRLLSTGVDMLTVAAAATNPRSVQIDDYDAVVFMRAPDMSWRGRAPGVRLLNDAVANRTPINSNNSYVLGNGIGAAWNGKAPLP